MIAEPYICIKGKSRGVIRWFFVEGKHVSYERCYYCKAENWQPYADFEREKLRGLNCVVSDNGHSGITVSCVDAYWVLLRNQCKELSRCPMFNKFYEGGICCCTKDYSSHKLIKYSVLDYAKDTEYNRLLKRAEFLKAVCEKEGVEWLPKNEPAREAKEDCVTTSKLCCFCGLRTATKETLSIADIPHRHCDTCNPIHFITCKPKNTDCSEEPFWKKKRTVRFKNDNGEWDNKVMEYCLCSTLDWRKCECPKSFKMRDRKYQEKANEFAANFYSSYCQDKKQECRCGHPGKNGDHSLDRACFVFYNCRKCKEEPCECKQECCIGFKLDGVIFHECEEHRPYCAKEWTCDCKKEYDEKEFRRDIIHFLECEKKHPSKSKWRENMLKFLRKKYL